jgi:hypothetical protein
VCLARGASVSCERPAQFGTGRVLPALATGTTKLAGVTRVVRLGLVNHAACALDQAGAFACYGSNEAGVLGRPAPSNLEVATPVPGLPAAAAVGLGARFGCALALNGEVWRWGYSNWQARGPVADVPPDMKSTGSSGRSASGGAIPESHPVASESTREGAVVGTPAYLSPEQASGKTDQIDERTDVFALGALLYHVVAGRPPYAGPSVAAVVARAAEADLEPLEQVAPEAPAALRSIVEKAMARLPDDRYGSAAELADALEAFLAGAVLSKPSRVLAALAWAGAVAALLSMLAASAQLWAFTPTLREQGLGALIVLLLAAAFLLLALIEWRTRSRYRLSPLLLALAGASFMLGLAGTFAGLSITLSAASAGESPSSAILLAGVYDTSGALVTASIVTAFELVIWGLLRRVEPEPARVAATATVVGIGARFRSTERR